MLLVFKNPRASNQLLFSQGHEPWVYGTFKYEMMTEKLREPLFSR